MSQEKFFFSAKTLQFNLNYSHTRVYFSAGIHHDCQETKSNTCNQINRSSSPERFKLSVNTILYSGTKSY